MSEQNADAELAGGRKRAPPQLALYHFEGCPYCNRVRQAARRLEIPLELRDIRQEPRYRAELIAARGRPRVPVLRIQADGEAPRWLPESEEIIRWLYRRAGRSLAGAGQGMWSGLLPWLPAFAIGAGLLFPAGRPWLAGAGVAWILWRVARSARGPGSSGTTA